MKFIFILDNLKKDCGPVVNIAMSLAGIIRKKRHKVYAITRENKTTDVYPDYSGRFDGIYIVNDSYASDLESFKSDCNWNKLSAVGKIKCYIRHPEILPAWLDWRLFHSMGQTIRGYRSMIERADRELRADVAVSFMMPHWTEVCISQARIKAKKCLFQMDPYVHYEATDTNESKKRQSEEEKITDRADKVFVTPIIYREMREDGFRIDGNKLVVYHFPGIKKDGITDNAIARNEADGNIAIFFVGNFYEGIRNPEYTLKLLERLPKNYVFHFVGKGAEDIVSKYKTIMPERIIEYGVMPVEKAYSAMRNADILLNIGNAVNNQVPSKLIDYINTGKPILNICKIKDCPSLEYINRYPVKCIVYEDEGINDNVIKRVVSFVNDSVGKTVPRKVILSTYDDCTDEYVADQLINGF